MGIEVMKDKRILLTGCTSGIGRALLEVFRASEAKVVAIARHATTMQSIGQDPAITLRDCDVRSEADVDSLFAWIHTAWQGVDLVINNAGVLQAEAVLRCSPDRWQDVIQTNLYGALLIMRQALGLMVQQEAGVIVNTASMEAVNATPGLSSYAASKAGLIALTKSAAREMVHYPGIAIIAWLPGEIRTALNPTGREGPDAAVRRFARLLELIGPQSSGKLFIDDRFVEVTVGT